jgi:hypothetical protein
MSGGWVAKLRGFDGSVGERVAKHEDRRLSKGDGWLSW